MASSERLAEGSGLMSVVSHCFYTATASQLRLEGGLGLLLGEEGDM